MNYSNYVLVLIILYVGNLAQIGQDQSLDRKIYFRIESAIDTYDSRTQILERLYTGGVKAFHVPLTDAQQERILNLLKRSDFTAYPDVFKPKTEMQTEVIPSFRYILESNCGGMVKKVEYNDRVTDSIMRKGGEPYLELFRNIWSVVYSNSEIIKIQDSDVIWE